MIRNRIQSTQALSFKNEVQGTACTVLRHFGKRQLKLSPKIPPFFEHVPVLGLSPGSCCQVIGSGEARGKVTLIIRAVGRDEVQLLSIVLLVSFQVKVVKIFLVKELAIYYML